MLTISIQPKFDAKLSIFPNTEDVKTETFYYKDILYNLKAKKITK